MPNAQDTYVQILCAISAKETAEKWGLTSRMVGYHCANGRIKGAQKIGNMWVVPKDAPKPDDRRKNPRIFFDILSFIERRAPGLVMLNFQYMG